MKMLPRFGPVIGVGKVSEAKMQKKAIIFDFDGLIIDSETTDIAAWEWLYDQVDLKLDLERYRTLVGSDGISMFDPAQAILDIPGETRSSEQIHRQMAAICI